MRLQFVHLSARPPKPMWETNSAESDTAGSTRKRQRGGLTKTRLPSDKRAKVCAGPIPAAKVAATEETYEEAAGIVCCDWFPSQPSAPRCSAPCCASSEGERARSFHNLWDDIVAALDWGSVPSFLQQPPLPSADAGEWTTTIPDHPACVAVASAFPLYDASLPSGCRHLDNMNAYMNSVGEDHLVLKRQRQEEAMARSPFQPNTSDSTWAALPFESLLWILDPCDQGSAAPTRM